jgi:gamma-glutamylaminecyclotransferase
MLIAGPWFAPMMLDEASLGQRVRGELYAVDEARLALIDKLEGIGNAGSFRRSSSIEPLGGGRAVSALTYMKDRFVADPIHSDYLEDYRDQRFVPPEQRPVLPSGQIASCPANRRNSGASLTLAIQNWRLR